MRKWEKLKAREAEGLTHNAGGRRQWKKKGEKIQKKKVRRPLEVGSRTRWRPKQKGLCRGTMPKSEGEKAQC
jgi:hypothetical protein